jgi:hypothetical protein
MDFAPPKRTPFPHAPEDFENDDRVSYSKLDNKWILEDDTDGSEWEFSDALGKWIPSVRFFSSTRLEIYIHKEHALDMKIQSIFGPR